MKRKQAKTAGQTRLLLALFGAACVVGGGIAHGYLTQRWGPRDELVRVAASLNSFPDILGPWRMRDAAPLDDAVVETLQCSGYVNRTYLNSESGDVVSVAVIVGPPGPISVHTPEICYSSRTYTAAGERHATSIPAGDVIHKLWTLQFSSNAPGGAPMSVYYAWSTDGVWDAPAAPRYEYGGEGFLCKIQIAATAQSALQDDSDSVCKAFAKELLTSGWMPSAMEQGDRS